VGFSLLLPTPPALTAELPADTAAAPVAGASALAARGDHVHRAVGGTAPPVVGSAAAAAGAALLAARADHVHALDDTGWIAAPLAAGWSNYSAGSYSAAAYRKVGPIVSITGLVKGPPGTDVFILPVGFRPARNLHFATVQNGSWGILEITVTVGTPGAVKANTAAGSATWLSIECTFMVA